jgi:signal transduction histidine kinase
MTVTINGDPKKRQMIAKSIPWIILTLFLCVLTFQESFLQNGNSRLTRGPAYIIYMTVATLAFSFYFYKAYKKLSTLTGIRRTELQFLSFSIGAAGVLLSLFNTFGSIFDIRFLNRSSIVIVFGAYVIIACALIFHRVFNARQVFAFLAQKTILIGLLCIGIIYSPTIITPLLPQASAEVVSILFCSAGVIWLNGRSKKWLGIDNDLIISSLRRTMTNLALKEPNTDKRRLACEQMLLEHFSASRIVVQTQEDENTTRQEPAAFAKSGAAYDCLAKTSWATPESLQRRRSSPASQELRDFMAAQALGVMVAVPRGSPKPSLIVGLGTKTNDTPFTYPEVLRLQNIAELMDNILARSQLTTQTALQAKLEHLAMMSRGLAHDMKNLITPISTYLVHTAARHQPGTHEEKVHDAAQRSVDVMNDYVREALFFSENMALHYEAVNIDRILADVRAVTASRSKQAGVSVMTVVATVDAIQADGVLLQRMLANLVANAIDASPRGAKVTVYASTAAPGWIRLQVVDQGCGIPAEHLERIFDPYFTTKEFGETVRGFGLGLTITQKIVQLHQGKISVQSSPGKGASITIDLPECAPEATHATPRRDLAHPSSTLRTPLHQ